MPELPKDMSFKMPELPKDMKMPDIKMPELPKDMKMPAKPEINPTQGGDASAVDAPKPEKKKKAAPPPADGADPAAFKPAEAPKTDVPKAADAPADAPKPKKKKKVRTRGPRWTL